MTQSAHIAQDDLVLYALGASTPEEAAAIAAHLAMCAECRAIVAAARGDMALLAFSVDLRPLPEGAVERFAQRVAASPTAVPENVPTPAPVVSIASGRQPDAARNRRSPWPVFVPWAVAATLGAVAISLGVENRNLGDTVNDEARLVTRLSASASKAQQVMDVLKAPHAQRATLTSTKTPPAPSGHAVYMPDRGALLFVADNMKPLPAGKTYELWVIPASGSAPMPAGTFKPDAGGYATVIMPTLSAGVSAKAFGVTIENDPGAATPTMPIIMAGE